MSSIKHKNQPFKMGKKDVKKSKKIYKFNVKIKKIFTKNKNFYGKKLVKNDKNMDKSKRKKE